MIHTIFLKILGWIRLNLLLGKLQSHLAYLRLHIADCHSKSLISSQASCHGSTELSRSSERWPWFLNRHRCTSLNAPDGMAKTFKISESPSQLQGVQAFGYFLFKTWLNWVKGELLSSHAAWRDNPYVSQNGKEGKIVFKPSLAGMVNPH